MMSNEQLFQLCYEELTMLRPEDTTDWKIGKYGRMRERYLKEHEKNYYKNLVNKGILENHLAYIEEEAKNSLTTMIEIMNEKDPPPGKETDPMGWVGHMNMTKLMAEEWVVRKIVLAPPPSF